MVMCEARHTSGIKIGMHIGIIVSEDGSRGPKFNLIDLTCRQLWKRSAACRQGRRRQLLREG
jgi:hypothetical protein